MTADTLYLACHLFFCIETKNQLCIQYLLLIQTNTPSLLLCQAWHLQTESLVDTSPKTKEGKTSRKTNRIGGLFPCTFNLGNENIDKRICFALFFPSNVFVIEIRTAFFFFFKFGFMAWRIWLQQHISLPANKIFSFQELRLPSSTQLSLLLSFFLFILAYSLHSFHFHPFFFFSISQVIPFPFIF